MLLLVVPPLATSLCFFLLTLALLLLLGRPKSVVEWLWILVAVLMVILWTRIPGDLVTRVTGTSALFFAGLFAFFTVAGVRSVVHRALLSSAATAALVIVGLWQRGVSYAAFRFTLANEVWDTWRQASPGLPEKAPASTGLSLGTRWADLSEAQRAAEFTATMSHFLGAYLALLAMLSAWMAWKCYLGAAPRPLAGPGRRFRDFRFTDHFIWVLIVLVAACLVPLQPWATDLVRNLLAVTVVLYAVRGAAILRTMLRASGPVMTALIVLTAVLLFAPVFCGCVALGVADTWFDLRRRMPPQGVPT